MLAAIVVSSALGQTTREIQFANFQTQYGKQYSASEAQTKFQTFSKAMDRITQKNQQNQANGGKAVFGVTRFSDLTPEQFQAQYLTYTPGNFTPPPTPAGLSTRSAPLTTLLPSLDWRNVNGVSYMTPVKDQGSCGACWAFSTVSTVESYQMLAGVYTQPLSPQQLTSCDTSSTGCEGGWTETGFDYIINYGATSETAYPYSASDSVCAVPSLTPPTAATSVRRNLLSLPTRSPSKKPTTKAPTPRPTTKAPTGKPTTRRPTGKPTTGGPTHLPTSPPTTPPPTSTKSPTGAPTVKGYPIIARFTSWQYVASGESNLQAALQPPPANPNGGPVSICLAADAFQDYTGGIITACPGSVNHCVQAAGYGTDAGVQYWLLRNQWGTSWGEQGYVRVQMGQDLCQLASDSMIYPIGVSA